MTPAPPASMTRSSSAGKMAESGVASLRCRSVLPLAPKDHSQLRMTRLLPPLPTRVKEILDSKCCRPQVVRLVVVVVPLEPHARSIACLPQPIAFGHGDDHLTGEGPSLGTT